MAADDDPKPLPADISGRTREITVDSSIDYPSFVELVDSKFLGDAARRDTLCLRCADGRHARSMGWSRRCSTSMVSPRPKRMRLRTR
mgnify:CR=1 FL=1